MSAARYRQAATALVVIGGMAGHVCADDDLRHSARLPLVKVFGRRELEKVKTTGDVVKLLDDQPGVSFYSAGGASRLPVLHGLNDDRIRILLDGAPATSACANHMNPALSYVDASQVKKIDVMAGITPVSLGGDSIGGTIIIDSAAPKFADDPQSPYRSASLSTFYHSNGHRLGMAAAAALADTHFSIGYAGAVDRADSYRDGRGDTVLDTLYKTENHALTFGARDDVQTLTLRLGYQYIPYQGFVNQYMDMVGNRSDSVKLHYSRDVAWGTFEARLFWQDVRHEMGFFTDEKTGSMPMNTRGRDLGYALAATIELSPAHMLKVGQDWHRFTLDDWWPALSGSMMMGPQDYLNINDGRRDRLGAYAESDYRWNAHWTSSVGVRADLVRMDTGDVQPYNSAPVIGMGPMAMPNPDAAAAVAFNARNHARSDTHIGITALAKYTPDGHRDIEFGYARKTRSPNLYERYAWGRGVMATTMISWFGDANGYVGNLDLKPETANTFSATFDWHDTGRSRWQIKATPYYTYVENYIDVDRIGTFHPRNAAQVTLPTLQFANHDAILYGVDLSWQVALWQSPVYGRGAFSGVLGYTHGERTDTGDSLYHIMPLHARLQLQEAIGAWTHRIDVQLVERKSRVQDLRAEQVTPGYALVNLHTERSWGPLRLDLGVSNLFDRFYALPLGGVNYAGWKAGGATGPLGSVPGPGRSLDAGVTYTF